MYSARICTAIIALMLVARSAFATDEFPGLIQERYTLKLEPACTICHMSVLGGAGTATKPFALLMVKRGLKPANDPSLKAALSALEAENSPAIPALKAGLDPNSVLGGGGGPEYGCVGSIAGRHSPHGAGAIAAIVFGFTLALWARRRRAHGMPVA